jgi:hypothetical protein
MKIRNWKKHQHFKNRKPPWIKLYRDILDDLQWHELPAEASKILVMLWLIASEGEEGQLPDLKTLSFRLRIPEKKLKETISTLSHWIEQRDIGVISERYQNDPSETERETEREVEKEKIPAKAGSTPQGDFVTRFKTAYESKTGKPYDAQKVDFVIAAELIGKHGLDACVDKAKILGVLCERRSAWFTKDASWGAFNVKSLKQHWNSIIPESSKPTREDEEQTVMKKQEEMRELANRLINRG